MSDVVLGETVVRGYTVWDQSNNPLTGMTTPADVVFYLHRQSGSTMIAAAEAVSWSEIGVTGHYYVSFTPLTTGAYRLQLEELNVNSNQGIVAWDFTVLSAGAVFAPSFANAFCAESDMERYLSRSITSTTTPNDTQAGGFAEEIAAILQSICARLGLAVTPATVTVGSRLEDLLRAANAIGASYFYVVAQQMGHRPATSEQVDRLRMLWESYVRQQAKPPDEFGYLITELQGNLVSLSTDQIISGDTLANPDTSAPYAAPIGIGMGDVF